MTEKNRKPLTFLSRATRVAEPQMSLATNLLPRATFKDDPETLALYDQYTNLREAETTHNREAGKENIAAEAARTAYLRNVRGALANGEDPGKTKDQSAKHADLAESHLALARQARLGLEKTARELAHRIAKTAPELLAPSEERLNTAADNMRNAIAALETAWAGYSRAWSERTILGNAALFGGSIGNYDNSGTFPAPVRAALDTLTDQLHNLERLHTDEAEIRAFRKDNA